MLLRTFHKFIIHMAGEAVDECCIILPICITCSKRNGHAVVSLLNEDIDGIKIEGKKKQHDNFL